MNTFMTEQGFSPLEQILGLPRTEILYSSIMQLKTRLLREATVLSGDQCYTNVFLGQGAFNISVPSSVHALCCTVRRQPSYFARRVCEFKYTRTNRDRE